MKKSKRYDGSQPGFCTALFLGLPWFKRHVMLVGTRDSQRCLQSGCCFWARRHWASISIPSKGELLAPQKVTVKGALFDTLARDWAVIRDSVFHNFVSSRNATAFFHTYGAQRKVPITFFERWKTWDDFECRSEDQ